MITNPSVPGFSALSLVEAGPRSTVYRAVRVTDGSTVILKVLSRPNPSREDLARYRYAGRLGLELAVPGLCRTLDVLEVEGRPVLVLEDIGGVSLRQLLRQHGRLSVGEVLQLGLLAADALSHLHAVRVLHKDINPANLIINRASGAFQIIDLDLASRLRREVCSPTGEVEGTLPYLSPEQTGRTAHVIDTRSDLYALGATLYELLVGAPPVQEGDALAVIYQHLATTPPSPQQRRPEVPAGLSAIVMKLLAKAPEDRYQSAIGLRADLRRAQERWEATGQIPAFPLATEDRAPELRLTRRLVGRDAEVRRLLQAYEAVSQGSVRLYLVAGTSGVGKTSLVREVHRPITRSRARFIEGKFNQYQNKPYAAPLAALAMLVTEALALPEAELQAQRALVREALGPAGGALAELLPEILHLTGPLPAAAPLPPTEAQVRLQRLYARFVTAFASAAHPLVVFIDDLQWADQGSLSLLRQLVTDPGANHLLVLGSYRDNEVSPGHPLLRTLDELAAAGVAPTLAVLGPLDHRDVTEILAESLGSPEVGPLAQVVSARTRGNPFFIERLCRTLAEDGVIALDPATGRWRWDAAAAASHRVSEDVAGLLAQKVRQLPPASVRALQGASAIGASFDLDTLSVAVGQDGAEVAAALWPAIEEDLLAPVGDGWRFVGSLPDHEISYRFTHDRVQEAAYAGVPEADRPALHLAIGRRLLSGDPALRDARLFEIVTHLNRGRALISGEERAQLAVLNHEAGTRAMASAAYEAAWTCFQVGADLIPLDHPLAFALWRDRGQAGVLCGQMADAVTTLDQASALASSKEDRVSVAEIRIQRLNTISDHARAIDVAVAALVEFGFEVPEDAAAWGARAGALLGELGAALAGRDVASLLDAPAMTDPDALLQMRILATVSGSAMTNPSVITVVVARMVLLSVTYGNSAPSPVGYVFYGYLRCLFGDHAVGDAFGQLAMRLAERNAVLAVLPPTYHIYSVFVGHYAHPVQDVGQICWKAFSLGVEAGVSSTAGWALLNLPWFAFWAPGDLGGLYDTCRPLVQVARAQLGNADAMHTVAASLHYALRLAGREGDQAALDAEGLSLDTCWEKLAHYDASLCVLSCLRFQSAVLFGDAAQVAALLTESRAFNARDLGLYSASEFHFYQALACADDAEVYPASAARVALAATLSPHNFGAKHRLIEAEALAKAGDDHGAAAAYDEAIAMARRSGLVPIEALACERAAAFYQRRGRDRLTRGYYEDARLAWLRWGAHGVVARLEARVPGLRPVSVVGAHSTTVAAAGTLDLQTVLEASQALTREIQLERLLGSLMGIAMANAGAQRGLLFLPRGAGLGVAATALGTEVTVLQRDEDVPHSAEIVAYAARTGETVLLDDAVAQGPFVYTAYVQQTRPRSVLAVPLHHQGSLAGVLYLENNLSPGAFTAERVGLLRMLTGIAATALQNALLYRAQQEVAEELSRKNAQLTQLDRMREEFLAKTSHELRTPLHGILGLARSLADGATGPLSTETRRSLDMIVSSGKRLSNLVNDILDLSTLQHRQLNVHLSPVWLGAVVEGVLAVCQPLVGPKALALRAELSAELPPVRADRDRLEQILLNLVGNAIKFTDHGEVVVGARVVGDRLQVTVQDTGIGIKPEMQARIFEAFDQGDAETSALYGGTGLGLAVARELVGLHGGALEVESAVGQGSVFRFSLAISLELPAEEAPAAPAGRIVVAPAAAPVSAEGGEGPLVLVVDDEPINLQVLIHQLGQKGYRVVTAVSGTDALRMMGEGLAPDLVLLDVMMPTLNGYEVCSRLRRDHPPGELPIVMLTARSQPADVVEGMGSGANDYVVKPFSTDELLARVRTHLHLAHMHRGVERFVPQDFLQLLGRPSVVEVQRGDCVAQDMTVLHSDVRGFSKLVEQVTPEEAFRLLNQYLGLIEPAILDNRGFVDHYTGANTVSLFVGEPDHALRAALAMIRALQPFNQERLQQGLPPLHSSMGINTGRLLLGTVGGTRHLDTTVVSDVVALAGRIEGLGARYQASLLVAEASLARLAERERVTARLIDRVSLEGRTETTAVYEVYEADPAPVRLAKDASRPTFEEAVRLFHARAFPEARRLFTLCQALNPGDVAVMQYLQRVLRIEASLMNVDY